MIVKKCGDGMERLRNQFENLESANVQEKINGYITLLTEIEEDLKEELLIELFQHVVKENVPVITPLFDKLLTTTLPIAESGKKIIIGKKILSMIDSNNASAFHSAAFGIRILISEALQLEKNLEEAYSLLKGNIPYVNSRDQNVLAKHYVKLAFLALNSFEFLSLKSYDVNDLQANNAYLIASDCFQRSYSCRDQVANLDSEYIFENKFVDASLNEASKNFQKAADKFYNLSKETKILSQDTYSFFSEALFISRAISNVLVSPVSYSKDRSINNLVGDERISNWEVKLILEKIFNHRLLLPSDIRILTNLENTTPTSPPLTTFSFPSVLIPYLPVPLLEENIIRLSELFDNISIDHMTKFLGVKEGEMLDALLPLLSNGVIDGKVSLVDGFVIFKTETNHIEDWTKKIRAACTNINSIAEKLKSDFVE